MSPPPSPEAFRDEVETAFTIERSDADDVAAELHTVDPPAEWRDEGGCVNLYFDVPAHRDLRGGTYRVRHPRLDGFRARFERVQAGGREPDRTGYRAVVVE
jgi:hypothetical protein